MSHHIEIPFVFFSHFNRNFTEHFSTKNWSVNGPDLLVSVVSSICRTKHFIGATPEQCLGLKIYNPSAFYPIFHDEFLKSFETNPMTINELLQKVNDSFAVHFDNHRTEGMRIFKSKPTNLYRILAERNCPKVIEASDDEFWRVANHDLIIEEEFIKMNVFDCWGRFF